MHPDIDPRLSLSTCHIFLGTTWDKILNLSLQRIPGVSFSSTPSCTFLQSCALQSGPHGAPCATVRLSSNRLSSDRLSSTSVLIRRVLGHRAGRDAPKSPLLRARRARNSKGLSVSRIHVSNTQRYALSLLADRYWQLSSKLQMQRSLES